MRVLGFRKSFAKSFTSSSVMLCFTLLQVVSLVLFTLPACSRQASYPSPVKIGPDIVIDTSVLERGVPKFFTYRVQDKKVNFFVIKMEDRILSFLDACASCYPHKQGYRCEDNAVICRYCDVRFPISKLEKGIGNCYPIKLEGRTEKNTYLISVDALDKAADKF